MSTAIPYRDLVFNLDVYPRAEVDQERVEHLAAFLDAGGRLPPIIVADGTNEVVDGFHRARAYFRTKGATVVVPCEYRDYPTRADLLLDAIRLNASHGKPLSGGDQARCVALAEQVGVSTAQVASVLNVTAAHVKSLAGTTPLRAGTLHAKKRVRIRTRNESVDQMDRPVWSAPVGLRQINELRVALQAGKVHMGDSQIRTALTGLARVIVLALKDKTDAA